MRRLVTLVAITLLLAANPTHAQVRLTLKGHMNTITCVAFSRDGKLVASGSKDETVRLWDAESGKALAVLGGHHDMVITVAFSPDGKLLASCSHDPVIKVWSTMSGKEVITLKGHQKDVRGLAFAPDGKTLASGSTDGNVLLWDTTTWEVRFTCKGHTADVNCVAFAPDGKTVVSGAWDNTVRTWDAATGKPRHVLEGHTHMVRDVAFTPNGKTLFSSGKDGTIRAWDVETGTALYLLDGHQGNLVRALSMLPSGELLASASRDGTLNLWDLKSGMVVLTMQEGVLSFQVLAFAPGGGDLATGGIDRNVTLLDAANFRFGAKQLPGDKVLMPATARKQVGTKIAIEMTVRAAKNRLEKRKEIYLDSEENFRDDNNFAVVINEAGAARFKAMGIADPAVHFLGKTIRVRGSVTEVDSIPRIVVEDPGQIVIRNP